MKIARGLDGLWKICTKCNEVFIGMKVILENFGDNRARADGLQTWCRTCRRVKKTKKEELNS